MFSWIAIAAAIVATLTLPGTVTNVRADDARRVPAAGTEEHVRWALSKSVSMEVTEKPLDEVVQDLGKQAKVTFDFDARALDAIGAKASAAKVTASFQNLRLRSCLRVILRELKLTYTVDEGVLLITTPEEAEQHLKTAVLDVSDLLGIEEGAAFHDADYDTLIQVITMTVAPTAWDEVGGSGAISGFRGTIVLNQTDEVIDQICQFLAAVRKGKQITAKHGDSPPPVDSIWVVPDVQARSRIEKALDSKADFELLVMPLDEVVATLGRKYQTTAQVSADDAQQNEANPTANKEPAGGTEAYLRQALSKPVSIEVTDKPLDEVIADLAKQANVTVAFRHRALDAVGLDASDLPRVTLTLHDLPLRSCLRVILREQELTYMVDESVLIITTPEDAEQNLATGVFDVADLLDIDEGQPIHQGDYDGLFQLITTTVAPTTWSEGNNVDLYGFRGMLVFQQTDEVIEQVRQLLAAIRKAKQITAKHGDSPPPVTSISAEEPPEAVNRIQKALDSKAELEFKDTPLNEAIDHLRKQYRIPIRLSESALDAVGLSPKTKITSSARSGTLRGALRRCLDDLELTYMIYEGVLTITTPEDAEQNLAIRVYPVQDLVEPIPWSDSLWAFHNDSDGPACMDYDRLVELTTQTVEPNSWNDIGGPGSAFAFSAYGLIVISQTEEMHQQIESLYTRLRKTIPAAAKKPVEKPADDEVRMVVYTVPGPVPDEQGRLRNVPNEREVLKLITSVIEPESWNKRDDVYAHAVTGRLIIRHTNAVHRQIRELARKLNLWGFGQPPIFQDGLQPAEGGFGGGFMNVAPEFRPFLRGPRRTE